MLADNAMDIHLASLALGGEDCGREDVAPCRGTIYPLGATRHKSALAFP
jgi:hypothetical protein